MAAINPRFAMTTKDPMDPYTSNINIDANTDVIADVEHGTLFSFFYTAEIVPRLLSWSTPMRTLLDCMK